MSVVTISHLTNTLKISSNLGTNFVAFAKFSAPTKHQQAEPMYMQIKEAHIHQP